MPSIDRPLALRLLGVLATATAVSVVVGATAGVAALAALSGGASADVRGGLELLGAYLAATAAGFLVGLAAYGGLVIAGVRRLVPSGRRLGTSAAMLAFPPTIGMGLGMLGGLGGADPAGIAAVVLYAAWVATVGLAVLWAAGAVHPVPTRAPAPATSAVRDCA